MKRVLVLLPASIAGRLIMESFASGFEMNRCRVLVKDLESLTGEELENFAPDMIFGYDYSYLMNEECKKIIEKVKCKNRVFYFADEPQSRFALGDRKELYSELKDLDAIVFVWDRDFVGDFKKSYYLPLAASPLRYSTDFSGYNYSISFVGRPLTEGRQQVLCDLVKAFKNKLKIFCFEKHFLQSVEEIKLKNLLDESDLEIYSKSWGGFIKTEQELAQIYSSSKVNLNITEQGKSSLNYRVFEVLASGGFLITDEREDLRAYFVPSKHLETYKDTRDLIDKIDFYMQNLNIAQRIAQLGYLACARNHNFSARARSVLNRISKG